MRPLLLDKYIVNLLLEVKIGFRCVLRASTRIIRKINVKTLIIKRHKFRFDALFGCFGEIIRLALHHGLLCNINVHCR